MEAAESRALLRMLEALGPNPAKQQESQTNASRAFIKEQTPPFNTVLI